MRTFIFTVLTLIIFVSCQTPQSTPKRLAAANQVLYAHDNKIHSQEWVKNIQTTRRINGDRYADLHLDTYGNSYITSHVMYEDKSESAYLVKIDTYGNKVWEVLASGSGSSRAYGLSLNHREEILWITGFFNREIRFGKQVAFGGNHVLFIAKFDFEGNCLNIITSEGDATGFNCAIDREGNLFVAGNCGQQLEIGNCSMKSEEKVDHFIAKFSAEGLCEWIVPMNGIHSRRIATDQKGSVYVVGAFHSRFISQSTTLQTLDSFDADGLLLKYTSSGKLVWHHQIGNKGNERYGFRSNEAISFIYITPSDRIFILGNIIGEYQLDGKIYSHKGDKLLYVSEFSPQGKKINFIPIATGIVERAVSTITMDKDGYIYISSMASDTLDLKDKLLPIPISHMSFIAKYKPDLSNREWIRNISEESDATFRSLQASPYGVFGAGHYRKSLTLDSLTVSADSVLHELFLMRLNK